MIWKEPNLIHVDPKHVVARLVALRSQLPPDVDVRKVIEGNPGVLLLDEVAAAAAAAAAKELQTEFPAVNVCRLLEVEPYLLSADCDVPRRLRRFAVEDRMPASLQTFYGGGVGRA